MWQLLREHPRSLLYALLVHLVLLALLVVGVDWRPKASANAGQAAPVQAVVVDQAKVDAEMHRLKQAQSEKQTRAAEHLKKLHEQAEKARRERQREQRRLAELEKKRHERAAEQKKAAEKAKAQQAAEAARLEKLKKDQAALAAKNKAEQQRLAHLQAKRKAAAEAKRKAAAEAKRKAEEEAKRKAEAEAKRKAAEEAKRKAAAEAKRKAEAEAKRKAAEEAKRKAQEEAQRKAKAALQQQLAAEQKQLAAQHQRAVQNEVKQYIAAIQQKVKRNWIRPPGTPAGLSCVVSVSLIPGGDVADAKIVKSSGNPGFDRSAVAAVYRAAPLPMPSDPDAMNQMRNFNFEFTPES